MAASILQVHRPQEKFVPFRDLTAEEAFRSVAVSGAGLPPLTKPGLAPVAVREMPGIGIGKSACPAFVRAALCREWSRCKED